MDEKTDPKERRRKRLETLYGQYISLLTYEGNLVSARFAHAIATQTIFFAAYFVVTTSVRLETAVQYVVQVAIAVCATITLIVYALILARSSVAATAWRASLTLIEEDSDFWYPEKREDYPDLDIFGSRSRALRRVETRQQRVIHAITSTRFKIILFMSERVRDPIDFYAIYFPAFFLVVWISLVIASTNHAARESSDGDKPLPAASRTAPVGDPADLKLVIAPNASANTNGMKPPPAGTAGASADPTPHAAPDPQRTTNPASPPATASNQSAHRCAHKSQTRHCAKRSAQRTWLQVGAAAAATSLSQTPMGPEWITEISIAMTRRPRTGSLMFPRSQRVVRT